MPVVHHPDAIGVGTFFAIIGVAGILGVFVSGDGKGFKIYGCIVSAVALGIGIAAYIAAFN